MTKLIYETETFAIRGAIYAVYREMGAGFLEAVYQECLHREFTQQHIPFVAQKKLPLSYKGEPLNQIYIADFICYDLIIVELKAVQTVSDYHRAQVHNYLKATGFRLGLIANFGSYPAATVNRVILSGTT
jgi:GxxExxY protein